MKKSQLVLSMAYRFGAPWLLDRYWGADRITVLAHHRVTDDATAADFPYYHPIVSATPALFEQQLAYVANHFNVIDLNDLVAFVVDGKKLPPRPLLITFDDGYLDNYEYAFPALKRFGFPAAIFLMTSRMEHSVPPWWDECAYYFFHTTRQSAQLPLIGEQQWTTSAEKTAVRELLMQALKRVPEEEKLRALEASGSALGVDVPPEDPGLFMNWDQVRDLVNNGIACMPHTVTHPILARATPEQQRREIFDSRDRVREETGQTTSAFAFPNGGFRDFDRTTLQLLQDAGFAVSFTLEPGPMRPARAQAYPYQIQRVFLSGRDSLERFVFKVMGIPAFQEPPKLVE